MRALTIVLLILGSTQALASESEHQRHIRGLLEEEPSVFTIKATRALDMIPVVSFLPEFFVCGMRSATPCPRTNSLNFLIQNTLGVLPWFITGGSLDSRSFEWSEPLAYPNFVASGTLRARKEYAQRAKHHYHCLKEKRAGAQ